MVSKLPVMIFSSVLLIGTMCYMQSFHIVFDPSPTSLHSTPNLVESARICDLFEGQWVKAVNRKPFYNASCPFHRNAWNCFRNKRENMDAINSWTWVPDGCSLPRIDPFQFLSAIRNMKVGFVGDSLSENFLVSFLCTLHTADGTAKKWKTRGAWRGGYFPMFNVTIAYHRAVLLARYKWQPVNGEIVTGVKGVYRVDVDVPASEWINITRYYDILVFNTGHWWSLDKFPHETPLVFYKNGEPVFPALGIFDGLKTVLEHMVSFIEKEIPEKALKFWRMQSPRHFHGGDWNQNGSCLFTEPLDKAHLDDWFDIKNGGINREVRTINKLIEGALKGRSIAVLNLTHLSEFRADAHPAIWLGQHDAVRVWGQDCLHWCLPGVPDTWVDILADVILHNLFSSM